MWQFDESAAQFPPPRVEEPAGLRREIVAELADHLTCAQRREQMAGGEQTEEAVRRRVLDRFGDPAAIARKLWLDWMWEKIMTQRILTGVCILLAIVTCAALAFAWVSINRQHDSIADLQLTSQSQLEQQQKQFKRLVADLTKSKDDSIVPRSIEWNPAEIKFVSGKENGPPLAGVKANLSFPSSVKQIPEMERVSDEHGVVRFERVYYGNYQLSITMPWGEQLRTSHVQRSGESSSRTIICPGSAPTQLHIKARIVWPKDLASRPLWFTFTHDDVYRPVGGHSWGRPSLFPPEYSGAFLVEPNGAVHGGSGSDVFAMSEMETGRFSQRAAGDNGRDGHAPFPFPIAPWYYFAHDRVQDFPGGIVWPDMAYQIRHLNVLVPAVDVSTVDELQNQDLPDDHFTRFNESVRQRAFFYFIQFHSADWSHQIESAKLGRPATLWITPTDEASEKVRAAVAEIDQAREAIEKAAAEAVKVGM